MNADEQITIDGSIEFNQTDWVPQTEMERALTLAAEPVFSLVPAERRELPDAFLTLVADENGERFEVRRWEGGAVIASTPTYRAAETAMRLLCTGRRAGEQPR